MSSDGDSDSDHSVASSPCCDHKQKLLWLIKDLGQILRRRDVDDDSCGVKAVVADYKSVLVNVIFEKKKKIKTDDRNVGDKSNRGSVCCEYEGMYSESVQDVKEFIGRNSALFETFCLELDSLLKKSQGQGFDKEETPDLKGDKIVSVCKLDESLGLKVLSDLDIGKRLLELLDLKKEVRDYRQISKACNDVVVTSAPSFQHCFQAKCIHIGRSDDDNWIKVEAECHCDMSIINSSPSNPFPIRAFKLNIAWKDHLQKLLAFGNRVEIDDLSLGDLPLIGRGPKILDLPIHPRFKNDPKEYPFVLMPDIFPKHAKVKFHNVSSQVTALPSDLLWLDRSLQTIASVITPARFQKLKKLHIHMSNLRFWGRDVFTAEFFNAATDCVLENKWNPDYQLTCLKSFELESFCDFGCHDGLGYDEYFLIVLESEIIKSVCGAAPNLTDLLLPDWIVPVASESRALFVDVLDTVCVPNLEYLDLCLGLQNQNEIQAVVRMLNRCKGSSEKLAVKTFEIRFRGGWESEVLDATELLNLVGDSVTKLHVRTDFGLFEQGTPKNVTQWPVMPCMTTLTTELNTFKSFQTLVLYSKMPNLKNCKISCTHVKVNEDSFPFTPGHDILLGFLKGDIPAIPVRDAPTAIKVSAFNLDELFLEFEDFYFGSDSGFCATAKGMPISWSSTQLTRLTLESMGCVTWFLHLINQFPGLVDLDVTVHSEKACGDRNHSYVDFAFTGLPFEKIYDMTDVRLSEDSDLCRQPDKFPHQLAGMVPSHLVSLQDRRDCLIHKTNLKRLTVRYSGEFCDRKRMSDWSGYHGFALMTHLESLVVATKTDYEDKNRTHVLSNECMEFVKKSLEPKTRVRFQKVSQYKYETEPPALPAGWDRERLMKALFPLSSDSDSNANSDSDEEDVVSFFEDSSEEDA